MRIPSREWCLAGPLPRGRKLALLNGPAFVEIVRRVRMIAKLHRCWRQRSSSRHGGYRACVRIVVPKSTVDLFHNSASGYRAQYHRDPALGERANAYALKFLTPRIKELLRGNEKGTCPWWWVERSLLDRSAKIWIHQGRWLRQARHAHRYLRVERWVRHEASPKSKRRKVARWAALIPNHEECLDIKGGFLTLEGEPVGSLKPNRSRDIHDYGFT